MQKLAFLHFLLEKTSVLLKNALRALLDKTSDIIIKIRFNRGEI